MATTVVRQLLEAGVHFGHQTKRWNPKMKRFIFGRRSGIYIIDLEKTEQCLRSALEFLESVAAKGQFVLFLGTKKQAKPILEAQAQRAGMPYVTNRWLGGTLTNFETIKANIDRLRTLRKQKAEGFFDRILKKEASRLSRQLKRLEEHFGGLAEMTRLPGCLFVVDTKREEIAVREANRLTIPIVAICDTNTDPDFVTYPIPGNDDAIRSITLLVSLAADSVMAGRRRFMEAQSPVGAPSPQTSGEGQPAGGETAGEQRHEPSDEVKHQP